MKLMLEDIEQESDDVLLVNDKMEHKVKIRMVTSEKLEVVAHERV